MGVGKSVIGRQLARRLKRQFWDSDREIELRTGVDIPTIFAYEGESGFRKREREVIADLTARQGIVLATGGGSVLHPRNRQLLSSRGFVVFLRSDIDTLLSRTSRDRKRPLLQTENPRARLESIMREREPLYREIADFTLDTNSSGISSSVGRILKYMRREGIDEPVSARPRRS